MQRCLGRSCVRQDTRTCTETESWPQAGKGFTETIPGVITVLLGSGRKDAPRTGRSRTSRWRSRHRISLLRLPAPESLDSGHGSVPGVVSPCLSAVRSAQVHSTVTPLSWGGGRGGGGLSPRAREPDCVALTPGSAGQCLCDSVGAAGHMSVQHVCPSLLTCIKTTVSTSAGLCK